MSPLVVERRKSNPAEQNRSILTNEPSDFSEFPRVTIEETQLPKMWNFMSAFYILHIAFLYQLYQSLPHFTHVCGGFDTSVRKLLPEPEQTWFGQLKPRTKPSKTIQYKVFCF